MVTLSCSKCHGVFSLPVIAFIVPRSPEDKQSGSVRLAIKLFQHGGVCCDGMRDYLTQVAMVRVWPEWRELN